MIAGQEIVPIIHAMNSGEEMGPAGRISVWREKLLLLWEGRLKSPVLAIAEEVARIFVAFCAVTALNYLLIYGVRAAWSVYAETLIGQHFIKHASAATERLLFLVQYEAPFRLALELAYSAALAALIVAVVSQLFLLRQLFYVPAGIFKPAWGILLTFCFALYGKELLYLPETKLAFMLFLPSALCLMPTAMKIAGNLVPDIVSLAVALKNRVEERFF